MTGFIVGDFIVGGLIVGGLIVGGLILGYLIVSDLIAGTLILCDLILGDLIAGDLILCNLILGDFIVGDHIAVIISQQYSTPVTSLSHFEIIAITAALPSEWSGMIALLEWFRILNRQLRGNPKKFTSYFI
ncbi:hypothetical protein V8G54_034879 [Vigna mungo]|uniref:Uncharacterized protein n=1 Tax=Vigna mungo TaxID=3915 RepID=A0AAQ3RF40_VIGMU